MPCSCCEDEQECSVKNEPSKARRQGLRFGSAAVLFITGVLVSVFYTTGHPLVAKLFFAASWFIAGYDVLLAAITNVRRGSLFDENFLMSVATIGAFFLNDFLEAASVMLFYNLGELVQGMAVEKSRKMITSLMDIHPEFARLNVSVCTADHEHTPACMEETLVRPEEVAVGSELLVKPGERVPLDGIVLHGESPMDTSSMTGESLPRTVRVGDEVLGGFINRGKLVTVKTTRKANETVAAKMLELIEGARARKAKTEKFITSFARIYTPIVTFSALALAFLPPFVLLLFSGIPLAGWQSFTPWVYRALVFLVISCPCAFVISVPLGYFGGIGGAAKKGILVKGADYIDALAKIKTAVFDKTGTITEGALQIRTVQPAEGIDTESLLHTAFLVEFFSTHPIATTIVEHAKSVLPPQADPKTDISNFTETAGKGVFARFKGVEIYGGSYTFLHAAGVKKLPEHPVAGVGRTIYFAADNSYAGYIMLDDSVKPEAKKAVENLTALGVSYLEILSGDTAENVQAAAAEVGIPHFKAGLLPHEKVERIETLRAEKANSAATLAFVGDGINDAPSLACADVGIAMGGMGSDAAVDAADVVLMNDNPNLLAQGIKTARFTRRIVAQNIGFAFAVKIAFLALGALGLVGLKSAVFADVGVALLAVLNSLRARQ